MKRILITLLSLLILSALIACDVSPENPVSEDQNYTKQPETSVVHDISIESESSEQDSDEIIEMIFSDINVRLSGTDALDKAGYKADEDFLMSVDITVKGKRSIIETLLADSFEATVDLSGVTESGNIEFLINYSIPEGVEFISASEAFATVKITKKSTEIKPVTGEAHISNGIIIVGIRGMESYGGSSAAGAATAEKLNQFKQAVGDDIEVYVMAPPLASAYYAPEKYPNSIQNHINCFNGLKDSLVGVKYVDVLTALSGHTDEDIYARTDHHWNALGAYYAAEEFSKVAGTPFDNLNTFTSESIEGVVGSLYTYSKDSVLKDNPDTFVWYVPTREYTVEYLSKDKATNPKTGMTLFSTAKGYTKFIYGDSYTTHITSNVGNGRKLLLFKDSYGNALAPFLLSSYDEVYIADFRYFTVNAKTFIEEKGITDVCFSLSAFAVAGKSREYITKLLTY